jgi:hypothetical protein
VAHVAGREGGVASEQGIDIGHVGRSVCPVRAVRGYERAPGDTRGSPASSDRDCRRHG